MIADPWFYALAVPAMIIAGISKGGFGGGVVVLAVPLMSLTVPPQQAAEVMLPILMAMDLLALWVYRNSFDRGHVRILLPAAAIGVGAGWASFGLLDAAVMPVPDRGLGRAINDRLRRAVGPAPEVYPET